MIAPIHSRWLAVALSTLLSGCGPFLGGMADRRAAFAQAGEGPIVVAVVDDRPGGGYLDGVRLAAEQINSSDERLLGRPIELLVKRGDNDVSKMLPTIRSIAANPTVTAVLGHRTSKVALPASITYEEARVLFMSPFATSGRLTLHGFDFVLRMLPDNSSQVAQTASLAGLFGYNRVAVLHGRSEYARAVAFQFEDAARRFDIDISFRGSFFSETENYRELIGQLKGVDFDAIFLSTEIRSGARVLRQLRELGINKPVLGSDALGSGPLIELAGDAADLTIVPTVFTPEENTNKAKSRFIQDYRDAYGREPNQDAAQGYDSINIFATIVERSGTTEARAISTTAHFTAPMTGVTGIYAYDPDGNIYGKSYRFKVMRFGRWWPLSGVDVPYLMARYQEVVTQNVKDTQASPPQQANAPEPSTAAATDPATAFTAAPANLEALTRGYSGTIERDMSWLGLAHEVLGFDRLGLVILPTLTHDVALVALARTVARGRGFEVEVCELPVQEPKRGGETHEASGATTEGMEPNAVASERIALEKASLRCYSSLARTVDALFVVTDTGLNPSYLKQLNRGLLHYGISTFALQDTIEHDYGLTLALTSSGVDLLDPNVALRFNGLLKGIRVHEMNQKISHLPSIDVDMKAAQLLGLFSDPRALTLISGVLDSSPEQPDLLLEEETN